MITAVIRKLVVRLGYYSKPDFLIIGAQKAGTTALFSMLKQHSHMVGAYKKEVHYFDDDLQYSTNYAKYHQYFPLPYKLKKNQLTFEASPRYLYHPKAAERIKLYNPKIKLIIVLRNPAQRALSAWSMYHYNWNESSRNAHMKDSRTFKMAIEEELKNIENVNWYNDKRSYIKRGIYYPQIRKYLDVFSREQILIIENQELKENHDSVIKQICNFLCIPHETLQQKHLLQRVQKNENDYPDDIRKLNEFYKPYNTMLYNLIGRSYNW